MNSDKWYARTADEALAFWQTDPYDGLSSSEVKARLNKFGFNQMAEKPAEPWWKCFLAQFQDFMVLVLLAATLISAFLGEYSDAVTILAIVIINAILGFVQEYRAEQSMQALKQLAAPSARVIRNGMVQQVVARELVPGDILVLEAGDKIAADGRLIDDYNLQVEEAALTGESLPVRKIANRQFGENVPLGDRKNMIYAGTSVTRGRGKAVVCATGMRTEMGHIAGLIQASEEENTPLERRLENLGRWLVWGCLAICFVVMVTGIFKGEPLFFMLMSGISLAVAAIPEGLPAIVTVSLALGVQRMIKRNAIVRKLPAVETLGCTTVICSDKTGTLTQNAMTVRRIYTGGKLFDVSGTGYDIKGEFFLNGQEFDPKKDNSLQKCLLIGALCNNSVVKQNNVSITGLWRRKNSSGWTVEGDPTEGALVVAAAKAGIWRETVEKAISRAAEIPFESERRRMSVVYRTADGNHTLYVKGAPDTVLELCRYYYNGTTEVPLTPELVASITAANESMTSQALRVLAVAYRNLSAAEAVNVSDAEERELVFVGLVGMIDPPREEAKRAIALCKQAGIKTVMITGDHRNTAIAIAKELQMYKDDSDKALTGAELDALSDAQLAKIANQVSVYARVSPAHKLRIVRALRQNGHIVAMTGDGVNDAPAIKEADIGVAMGITGTDVSKEASSMVLLDDNFATIVGAVEEGRGIYDNIRKFIRYLLSCNIGEVLTMFIAALAGMPLPLLPVQILWVNLVTDGLPAMALGVDPSDPDIMNRPPRHPAESVFSRGLIWIIVTRGIQIGLSTVLVFAAVYYWKGDLSLARTMAFSTLVFCQLFHVFDCRSEVLTIHEIGILTNKFLVLAVFCSITMQLAVIYIPFLRGIFETAPLSLIDWACVLVVSGWTFILSTLRHFLRRRPGRRYAVSYR
ncbi:calcium-transporting P-type ATPase, PMR1-type [Sporolituus thermophilus]|uniref:P-type Ca(2+) transporter n=1 Tax=Sporolituus thermophilus DSM 23256 TaxID=1123285 RepID=A0A1G7KS58_9FIRM|nr:calcium-transporting P-type ATPase, PMR1-type [Sporolituus thermophilus]SDF39991.1 Ca2+-transporting ATPase [Sporolituus thermophilus DSM 23256]